MDVLLYRSYRVNEAVNMPLVHMQRFGQVKGRQLTWCFFESCFADVASPSSPPSTSERSSSSSSSLSSTTGLDNLLTILII